MALEEYREKRSFQKTPEPPGALAAGENQWRFVVQKHDASRLHYDLRLEFDGVLLSWAVPKGPSLDWADKRLAVHVEDHPIEYLDFEGVIPRNEYGGGTVMVWDMGHWQPRQNVARDLESGELKFDLDGKKLQGGWMLKRLRGEENQWLLIKEKDSAMRELADFNVLRELPNSVLSDRSMEEIAEDHDAVWSTATSRREPYIFDADQYPSAKLAPFPNQLRPCLPTATRTAPSGDKWVHEIKYDGYRMLCHFDGETARMCSRSGKDWTHKFRTLARTIAQLPIESAVFDGEVVVMDEHGITSFQTLQHRIGSPRDTDMRYCVFDLVYLNGFDLTKLPLLDRKQILTEVIATHTSNRIFVSDHMTGDGPVIFRQASKLGVEGIVSKQVGRGYTQGRCEHWLKTKCLTSREFLIGGFTPSTASRQALGAILLGIPDQGDQLRYAGKVGTGFSHDTLVQLRKDLEELRLDKTPFHNLSRREADKGTVWVQPTLVAEIEFGGWTNDGLVRFGSFRGIREDIQWGELDVSAPAPHEPNPIVVAVDSKPRAPADVAVEPGLDLPQELASVKLSNPDRLVYPDMGITKLGVATYYAQVGPWMLPHISGRPVSLFRCPGGVSQTCFFQKRAPQGIHESVEQIELPASEGQKIFMVVHDLVGLISLVQFGVLEFHISGGRADKFDKPDRLVIDLDPDEFLPWSKTKEAAQQMRDWLKTVGLESFLKTTGGKGLHIVVPIRRRHTWSEVKDFARKLASTFERRFPKRFTANASKSARRDKILLDVLRNSRGATAVAAYSTRAKNTASVSVPISWDELDEIDSSDGMTLQSVMSRLASRQTDPWYAIGQIDQGITKKAWNALD